ncbi:MAG TPA: hypothetical protein VL125_11450 [Pelobium sp.]|jgi:hypothetical protein|nr:hypothetical protein [Pelobium sp.]
MTFQDRGTKGKDWDKVKNKRKLMHTKNDLEANLPGGVIRETEPKVDKK